MGRNFVPIILCVAYLGLTTPAFAHVTASPSFVAQGEETELAIAVPNERAPRSTTGLVITLPVGIALVSTASPSGWTGEVENNKATWRGGPITGTTSLEFTMRVRATAPPGIVTLTAVQLYDDDASVNWKTSLTIVPGQASSGSRGVRLALGIGAAATLVLATLLMLRRSRRRITQDG